MALAGGSDYALGTILHTTAMLVVAGAIAVVVYYRVGLGLLRRAWFNLDRLWAIALVASGIAALVA